MAGYNEPSFQDRVSAAAKARETALAKLKAKAQIDPAERERRIEEARARDRAWTEKRNAARAAIEARRAEVAAMEAQRAAEHAAQKAAAPEEAAPVVDAGDYDSTEAPPPVRTKSTARQLTDEERKAERDAKYAARKARKGR